MAPALRSPAPPRVVVISLHTSPLDQPGAGDSGGMNVEIRKVAGLLAARGIAVDAFTRCAGRAVPEVQELGPLTRVIQVPAGPCAPVARHHLPELLSEFGERVADRAEALSGRPDLVHAHYWLSTRAAGVATGRWDVPLVASFHTLGEVKNRSGEAFAEPSVRVSAERRAVGDADLVLAPTPAEAEHLVRLYGAFPDRVRVVPPGVDAEWFRPWPKGRAKARLGLSGRRVALFVGRLQPMKGPDVAIRTVARVVSAEPSTDLALAIVGGPSGPEGPETVRELRRLAREEGIADRLRFLPPQPHDVLPEVYSAADVLLMPSRSESFGLAALEAQSCGVPVVAADVGGLGFVVADGHTGFLVRGHDPADHAARLMEILRSPVLAERLSRGARARASAFPWEVTVEGTLAGYRELVPGLAPAA